MHLSYDRDVAELRQGHKWNLVSNALSIFSVEDRDGELVRNISDERYADALYSFVQSVLKIADVADAWQPLQARKHSTFMDDFQEFLRETIPEERMAFNWCDPQRDHTRKYIVDCRISGMPRPIFLHGLPNDSRTRDATLTLHQCQKWEIRHHAIGIFEDKTLITRNVRARYHDVSDKSFPSLSSDRDKILLHLRDHLQERLAPNSTLSEHT